MFGPDERLYACQNCRNRIVAYTPVGALSVIADGVNSNDNVHTSAARSTSATPSTSASGSSMQKVPNASSTKASGFPNGCGCRPTSPCYSWMTRRASGCGRSGIQADGPLSNAQPFLRVGDADESSASGADGMAVDTEGYLDVTSRIGLQVCD